MLKINFNSQFSRKSSSSSPTTATNHSVSMFFQSLLPSFNLNNAGGNANAEQQQQVAANVEQAAARIAQAGGNRVNDEVAESNGNA
ncbi:hypothetical protein DOY81_014502 [Sarcophaga bullata]|nr:hypothetical protein DOY81_014502 [Sarcophaga bullata]